MFALDDLARVFELTVREDVAAGGLTVAARGQTIVLSAGQPLASVGGRLISLSAAPAREGRAWFVPADFVSRALALGARHPDRRPAAVAPDRPGRRARPADRRPARSAGRARPADARHLPRHPAYRQSGGHAPARFGSRPTRSTRPCRPRRCRSWSRRSAPATRPTRWSSSSGRASPRSAPPTRPATAAARRLTIDVAAQTTDAPRHRRAAGHHAAATAPELPPLLDLGARRQPADHRHRRRPRRRRRGGARAPAGASRKSVDLERRAPARRRRSSRGSACA